MIELFFTTDSSGPFTEIKSVTTEMSTGESVGICTELTETMNITSAASNHESKELTSEYCSDGVVGNLPGIH